MHVETDLSPAPPPGIPPSLGEALILAVSDPEQRVQPGPAGLLTHSWELTDGFWLNSYICGHLLLSNRNLLLQALCPSFNP